MFHEGDDGRDVHIVLTGLVKVFTTSAGGREVILDVLDAGSVLGELSAIDGDVRSASAAALTEVEVLLVGVEPFIAFLDHHPAPPRSCSASSPPLRNASQRQLEFGQATA